MNAGIARAYTYSWINKIWHMTQKGTVSAKWVFKGGR